MLAALLLLACTEGEHPLDDVLSLNDAQVVGTHNSYHIETAALQAWAYTHRPLDEQMVDLGVRQFELDLNWVDDRWEVFHIPVLDEGTTCRAFDDCLQALLTGSETLGPHLPVLVLLEIKQVHDENAADRLRALNTSLTSVLGPEHLVTPGDLGGTTADVAAGMSAGWPVLEGQRGAFIPVIHDDGDWAATAREVQPDALFLDGFGDLAAPWAAYHSMNNPDDPRIAEVVSAGHLVRTRADSDTEEARAGDTSRRDAALASGATFISTDFPSPHPETGYVVEIPGGEPAGCSPVGAPSSCEALALEDPALLE
ncbi:MAG: Ca2+-dependent phosphoinositide-specific phospholipase C [Myxococcota bacterium]